MVETSKFKLAIIFVFIQLAAFQVLFDYVVHGIFYYLD